jgi:hypothetical protein
VLVAIWEEQAAAQAKLVAAPAELTVARDVVITEHLAGLLEARVELAEARPALANAPLRPFPRWMRWWWRRR